MSDPREPTSPQDDVQDATTQNEFEAPGANYPDTGTTETAPRDDESATTTPAREASDHHGQDGGRDTVWAGSSQDAMAGDAEQSVPSMSQNNASDEEKVAGIVAQVRADLTIGKVEQVRHLLTERLTQAGVDLPANAIDDLVDRITTGT